MHIYKSHPFKVCDQWAEKVVAMLAGVVDSDYWEIGRLFPSDGEEENA